MEEHEIYFANRYFFKKWNIPDCFILKAQHISQYLLETTEQKTAMHGDLYHDNILRDDDKWKVIDPAGVVGDSVYEISSFMINPIDKIWKCCGNYPKQSRQIFVTAEYRSAAHCSMDFREIRAMLDLEFGNAKPG